MKKLLSAKLFAIAKAMTNLETTPNYWLTTQWSNLIAQKTLIIDIMADYEEQERKPYIDDINLNFKMGLISIEQKEIALKAINDKVIDY